MDDKVSTLKEWINESNKIVFFGGAGVSTESGIPDFRSQDGLYNMDYKYPPEQILSHTFFENNTEEFYKFYKEKLNCLDAKPNITHEVLSRLEKEGKLTGIVTQNIDGLHEKAGNKYLFELHGSIYRNYCTKCKKFHDANYVFNSKSTIPYCEKCGGLIKPDVVLYEEELNKQIMQNAIYEISRADMLIIGGSSLTVFPASNLIYYFKGKHLVLINKDSTIYDFYAGLTINEKLGEVFKHL